MTARDEILEALDVLGNTFTPDDVVRDMRPRGSSYAESTIRTHVVSRMCSNAPDNHARTYDDLERVRDGVYRRRVRHNE